MMERKEGISDRLEALATEVENLETRHEILKKENRDYEIEIERIDNELEQRIKGGSSLKKAREGYVNREDISKLKRVKVRRNQFNTKALGKN